MRLRHARFCLLSCCIHFFMHVADAALQFQNPINGGADPWMVYYQSNYYLTSTQGDAIRIWKGPTLAGLKVARPKVVWRDEEPSRSSQMWAAEFHLLNGRWYLYYT